MRGGGYIMENKGKWRMDRLIQAVAIRLNDERSRVGDGV